VFLLVALRRGEICKLHLLLEKHRHLRHIKSTTISQHKDDYLVSFIGANEPIIVFIGDVEDELKSLGADGDGSDLHERDLTFHLDLLQVEYRFVCDDEASTLPFLVVVELVHFGDQQHLLIRFKVLLDLLIVFDGD
jgi:hypothetical protein